ncbi:MAG: hypothetical protein HFH68_08070 [Lachnospiraceae bacterium]|nr:hypothetical protein [Lachnospiraceae bacterium]
MYKERLVCSSTEWIFCSICGSKTHNKSRKDTVLINYPPYHPEFKQETLIEGEIKSCPFYKNSSYNFKFARRQKVSSVQPGYSMTGAFCAGV